METQDQRRFLAVTPPDAGRAIVAGGDHLGAIGTKHCAAYVAHVAAQNNRRAATVHGPNRSGPIVRGRDDELAVAAERCTIDLVLMASKNYCATSLTARQPRAVVPPAETRLCPSALTATVFTQC